MDESKSVKLQSLEQSLISFLMQKKDLEERMGASYRRIKSIQIQLNDKNPKHITFTVLIGMFSAEFNLLSGLKEKGSCLGLEKYIRDWSERDSIKNELLSLTSLNKGGTNTLTDVSKVRNLLR